MGLIIKEFSRSHSKIWGKKVAQRYEVVSNVQIFVRRSIKLTDQTLITESSIFTFEMYKILQKQKLMNYQPCNFQV